MQPLLIGALLTRGEYKINSPRCRLTAHLSTHQLDDIGCTRMTQKAIKKARKRAFCGPLGSVVNGRVGETGFEPATTRPPDVYSNRAELLPVAF